jgi:signal transduction histidine kinase
MQEAKPQDAADAVGVSDEEVPNYRIRPLSLCFEDIRVEQRFNPTHLIRALPTIRLFFLVGALLYAVFGILDIYAVPTSVTQVWTIRFGVIIPFLLSVVALSYTQFFRRWAQPVLAASLFVSGFSIILMTAVSEPPGNAEYYAGLIIVVIYGSSLISLRFINAAIVALVLFAIYQIVSVWINPLPPLTLLSNDFFLGLSVAVGIFSSYVQELQARKDFISTEMLQHEKEKTNALLTEATAASKAKSDFLAVMSHELRTPLNAILGFSEIMQLRMFGPIGSDRYAAYVDDIHFTAKHLLNIITDVLDFSKAEVGRLTVKEEEVDVTQVLEQCLRLLRERAAEFGLRMSLETTGPQVLLRADVTLIKQLFINLVGNAIKFTQPGGEIRARIEHGPDGGCLVKLTDTGIGIAETDIERVFEPFYQVETVLVRKRGGTGLGLPLSRKIMQLHGGSLTLESNLGVGTTVTLAFPASRVMSQDVVRAGVA